MSTKGPFSAHCAVQTAKISFIIGKERFESKSSDENQISTTFYVKKRNLLIFLFLPRFQFRTKFNLFVVVFVLKKTSSCERNVG